MRTAVITIAHGRRDHLARQIRELDRQTTAPDRYVVIAMDDPAVRNVAAASGLDPLVVEIPGTSLGLPLAAARNLGARLAIERGAELLIFLDADCMPDGALIESYAAAAADPSDRLLCGPVAYLPSTLDPDLGVRRLAELTHPHPARPAPPVGVVEPGADHALFWSLSFAVTTRLWCRIGGFCEEYVGYGGEDTDFAQTAKQHGIDLAFVGGARAFHQFHPTSDPPVQHVDDIVRNANLYRRRWGSFPMLGWLDRFASLGLVALDPVGTAYAVVADPSDEPRSPAEIGATR
jgi:N-acetylglucosaminyl-diphospho-decaprenol L-rhamnosyltransferase